MNSIVLIAFLAAICGASANNPHANGRLQPRSGNENVSQHASKPVERRSVIGCEQTDMWERKSCEVRTLKAMNAEVERERDDFEMELKKLKAKYLQSEMENTEPKVSQHESESVERRSVKGCKQIKDPFERKGCEVKNLKVEIAVVEGERDDFEYHLNNLNGTCFPLKLQMAKAEEKLRKQEQQIESLTNQRDQYNNSLHEAEGKLRKQEQQIESLTNQRDQYNDSLHEAKGNVQEKMNKMNSLNETLIAKEEEIAALKLQHEKETEDIETSMFTEWNISETLMISAHKAEMTMNEEEYNRTKFELEETNDQLQRDINEYSRRNSNLTAKLEDLKQKMEEIKNISGLKGSELENANTMVENMERDLRDQKEQISQIETDLNDTRKKQDALEVIHNNQTRDLKSCQNDLNAVRSDLGTIRVENEKESKCSSSNATVFKCYNQGRCRMQFNKFSNKIEPYCQCARGFTGQKCEDKGDDAQCLSSY